MFPTTRMRRLRKKILIDMIEETTLNISDLIYPIFIDENIDEKKEINSMPGIYRWPLKEIVNLAVDVINNGIKAVLLFGIPKYKDDFGSDSYKQDGIIQNSIFRLKNDPRTKNKLIIIADLCLCEYTTHGHCGIIEKKNDEIIINNDETIKILQKIALSYANSGVDIIAPSGMMDGSVKNIRYILDKNNFSDVLIMSYASKFNSSLYSPFRDAADSSFLFGDRSSYQINIKNKKEALKEVELDIKEGTDIVIVKPGIFYLDIIKEVASTFNIPTVAYQVSGEYSMIKSASNMNYINELETVYESLIAFKRSGATMIITYYALEIAKYLLKKEGNK